MLDALAQDVRLALRHIRRAPGFSAVVIVTLALGVGANTAIYSLLNAVVLRTVPVRDPQRLAAVSLTDPNGSHRLMYHSAFAELERRQRSFEMLFAYSGGRGITTEYKGVVWTGGCEGTTPEYYSALRIQPFLGRLLAREDLPSVNQPAPVVIVSHRFWELQLGGDRSVIGERLNVDGMLLTIIGVLPPEFRGLQFEGGSDIFVSLPLIRWLGQSPAAQRRPVWLNYAIGHLRPGVTLAHARAEIEVLWTAIGVGAAPPGLTPTEAADLGAQRVLVDWAGRGFSFFRLRFARTLFVLIGLTVTLLAIACVNLSGLLLARGAAREQQFAICLSLGATRARLVQQLVVESLMLSGAGSLAALPLAWWASRALGITMWTGTGPSPISTTPDTRALALTAAVAAAAGVLIGLLPALKASRGGVGLRPAPAVARGTGPWVRALLVAQVALSLVLLVGAGLFARSLAKLQSVDLGFSELTARRVLWTRLGPRPGGYSNFDPGAYYPELARQLAGLAGVESVGFSRAFPAALILAPTLQPIARSESAARTGEVGAGMEIVSPAFFETVRVPLLEGRDFTWDDRASAPPVAIINDALRRRLFPQGSGIGATLKIGADAKLRAIEVVGVVSDLMIASIRLPHTPVIFRPMLQEIATFPIVNIRTSGDPMALGNAVTRTVGALGREQFRRLYTLEGQVDQTLTQDRLMALLSSYAGGVAVLLAFVGLYGLLAFSVVRRTREIGVRMALGATRSGVLRMIVREGLLLTLLGVAIGIPVALAAGRLIGAHLYGVAPSDPLTLGAAALFFVALGAGGGLIPARRASTIDPMTALRCE